jgi:hypothetical protein
VRLFHRTTVSQAGAIIRAGFQDEKWSFGSEDESEAEARIKVTGVWLTDRPLAWDDGPPGSATLEVTIDLPEAQVGTFEISGVLDDARLFVVPANVVNPHSKMRIEGVDQRTSWFGEKIDDEDDDEEEEDDDDGEAHA